MVGRRAAADFPHRDRSRQLAEALKVHRKDVLNISRSELAERSGVSASSIQAIEDGRTLDPGVFTVMALAVAMQVDVSEILRSRTGRLKPAPLHAGAASGGETPRSAASDSSRR